MESIRIALSGENISDPDCASHAPEGPGDKAQGNADKENNAPSNEKIKATRRREVS